MYKEILAIIKSKNNFQYKYLMATMKDITNEEIVKLEKLIEFYIEKGNSVEDIAEAFLNWVKSLMEEQRYFIKNGCYRYSTLKEVSSIYKDETYMNDYVIGLGLSTYLWDLHRNMMRFYINKLKEISSGGHYLEIGPGHGEYFVVALEQGKFDKYTAVDISRTSVEFTKEFVEYSLKGSPKKYSVLEKDFFQYTSKEKFDAIVMGEVLEHVENPVDFLNKINEVAKLDSYIYITTAINAPQLDHIHLFTSIEDVMEIINEAKFEVVDYTVSTAKNIPVEKAIKNKLTITIALVIKKSS